MGLFGGGRRSAKDGADDDEDEVLFSGGSTVRSQQPGAVVRANGDEETAKRCDETRRDARGCGGSWCVVRLVAGVRVMDTRGGVFGVCCEVGTGVFLDWIAESARRSNFEAGDASRVTRCDDGD